LSELSAFNLSKGMSYEGCPLFWIKHFTETGA
jgi:hypothetical protein